MHAVILHGGTARDVELEAAHTQLCAALGAGWTTTSLRIEDMRIRSCSGCFGCWLKTPGECVIDDDGRAVARALAVCDLRVILTPVSFGGYGGLVKLAVDRMIPNISPLFQKIDGEMHHQLRYPHPARFLVVGWQAQPNADSAAIFSQLVRRNAINMHAPTYGSLVLTAEQPADEQRARIDKLVKEVIQ